MVVILTSDEILHQGLKLAGFQVHRIQNVSRATNVERFKAHYGSDPVVYAQIWEDLQFTNVPDARIDTAKVYSSHFLMSLFFLKCYPSESQLAASFSICEKTARKWRWFFVHKIQALKTEKIVWPQRWTPGHPDFTREDIPVFLLTVDGVHCRVHEPKHPTRSKDSSYYSHKFKQSGLNYELGVSVFENKLVWMNGPFKASRHDISIYRQAGLKDMIPEGHRVIGDRGYMGEPIQISTPNSHDPVALRKFKSRARARHESFNARIKNFRCLEERFRHGIKNHKAVFEAICVICQYQLENGSPLFDT